MPLVAGVDSSTSACKVQVRDADTGELVASGRAPHPPTTPPRSEQHPADWWAAFEAALRPDRGLSRPAAIAVGGQQHGLVVLDDAGEVLRPAKLWNDTESAPDAAALVDALGARGLGRGVRQRARGQLHDHQAGVAPPVRARGLRAHRPGPAPPRLADPSAHRGPHDRPRRRLRHRLVVPRRRTRTGTDLLDLVGAEVGWLPRVLGPFEAAGEWGGAVVGPGTGDNMAAALGLGLRPGDLALSLGTSGTAYTSVSSRVRTRRAPWPASPTPRGGSCPWSAR